MSTDKLNRDEARRLLWAKANLSYKLHSTQLKMREQMRVNKRRLFVMNCSRQLGKSFLLCAYAVEVALSKPGMQIKYATPEQKQTLQVIKPHFLKIFADCPPELRPTWKQLEGKYEFPNGSYIQVAGCSAGHDENLRGTSMDLGIIDEAATIVNLDYLYKDILFPQTLTTKGKIIMASTPAKVANHPFERMAKEAILKGNYTKYTIHDNPMITQEDFNDALEMSGGETSTTWRREYLAEFIIDEQLQVIPEFDEKRHVGTWERPAYMDTYVAMDVGFRDLTFVVFAYYDFKKSKIVVESELVLERVRTDVLAEGIKDIEFKLWAGKKPFLRVSDIDLILINDLNQLHNLHFIPTDKDNKEAQVNHVRMMFQKDSIIIDPSCKNLINHIKFGVWNKDRSTFERMQGYGHFDGIDALIYLVRNIRRAKNPFPANRYQNPYLEWEVDEPGKTKNQEFIKTIFKSKLIK